MTAQSAVSFARVHKVFQGSEPVRALTNITLGIEPGSLAVVAGPSGSGKTTLLTLAGALDHPTSGSVTVCGIVLNELDARRLTVFRREYLGFVFQDFKLIEVLTATANVALALELRGHLRGAARKASRELLDRLGLAARADHYPAQLSAGEKQRVAIARALVTRPRVILADEPTANLDWNTGEKIVALLHSATRERGTTVVLVSHDPRVVPYADHTVHLLDGRLAAAQTTEEAA